VLVLQGINFSAAFYYDMVNPGWTNHGSRTSDTSDDKSVHSHPSSSEVRAVSCPTYFIAPCLLTLDEPL